MGDWKKGSRAGGRAKSQEVSIKVVAEITEMEQIPCT